MWYHSESVYGLGRARSPCPANLLLNAKLMKSFAIFCLLVLGSWLGQAASTDFAINSFGTNYLLRWTNAFSNGVCTVEAAPRLANPGVPSLWQPQRNYFTTGSVGQASVPRDSSNQFLRLLAVDVSTNTPLGYTNLLQSYGNFHTIAGNGFGGVDTSNYWQSSFEGGYATNAALSRPHYAMADNAGNVFIVDKDSHSVLKVTPDGRIHTVAGTHTTGNGTDASSPATSVALNFPNGLWVRGDGTVYVMDTGNNKIRRVDTNGMMATLFTAPASLIIARGLWVKPDETEAIFGASTIVEAWSASTGFSMLTNKFKNLGNIFVTPLGQVIVTDRGDSMVFRVETRGPKRGQKTHLYGSGKTTPVVEGTLAATNGFYGVRGVWAVPSGGYLFALHEGNQLLYVNAAGIVHVFVAGDPTAHSGDGQWFHSPGFKVSQLRSVSMDSQGNIIIVENDNGFVRRIDFQRLTP